MKTALIIWVLLSAPISLSAVGWGLFLIYSEAGLIVFAICCVSLITSALGIAAILDKHSPLPPRRQDAR